MAASLGEAEPNGVSVAPNIHYLQLCLKNTKMESISSTTLVDAMRWRYATKQFDSERKIPENVWDDIEETLVLTPSSYGLQPWKFFVVTDENVKKQILPHSWNQRQVVDCSHLVVFARPTNFSAEDVDRFIERTAEVREVEVGSLSGFRDMMVSTLIDAMPERLGEWAVRQCYIALGNLMTAAAMLKVDACPMEGFVPAEVDRVLGFPERELTTAVMCPMGYRVDDDKYASLPKVRYRREDVVERV